MYLLDPQKIFLAQDKSYLGSLKGHHMAVLQSDYLLHFRLLF